MRSLGVALLFVIAAGCSCNDCGDKDPGVVARLDEHHRLAAPVVVGNLTVWPVHTDTPVDLGEFLTLEEALAKGTAEVREVGAPEGAAQSADATLVASGTAQQTRNAQESGQTLVEVLEEPAQQQVAQVASGATVGTLVIENMGDLPILVCAGTVVKGGNQDRQIGQDFVIKAKSETPVDAFCVEQGRWQQERLGADTGGKFEVLDGMATAKVRMKGQYEKDQSGVWQEVATVKVQMSEPIAFANPSRLDATFAFPVQSSSFAVAFDANAEASKENLQRCEDAVKKHFAADAQAVGFAYAINGKPVAVRTFAHPRLLAQHLDTFVRGMATEALLEKTDAPSKAADPKDLVALVAKISTSNESVEKTTGLNRNGIRVHAEGYNANCYVADKDGKSTALTRDWTAK